MVTTTVENPLSANTGKRRKAAGENLPGGTKAVQKIWDYTQVVGLWGDNLGSSGRTPTVPPHPTLAQIHIDFVTNIGKSKGYVTSPFTPPLTLIRGHWAQYFFLMSASTANPPLGSRVCEQHLQVLRGLQDDNKAMQAVAQK